MARGHACWRGKEESINSVVDSFGGAGCSYVLIMLPRVDGGQSNFANRLSSIVDQALRGILNPLEVESQQKILT